MNIYLVRHGQSIANVDKSVHTHTADHAIPLSPLGAQQARLAGRYLNERFFGKGAIEFGSVRIWHSPYLRARQTANEIEREIPRFVRDKREHLFLAEQQFGLFDGISHEGTKSEIERKYPNEYDHYKKCERFEGGFWARMPLGESKFDLSLRVHQAFGTFQRDVEKHGIRNLVIVAHGSTNRAFIMMWQHLGFEWFEKEPNPKNGSIRLISNGEDMGYIFEPNQSMIT